MLGFAGLEIGMAADSYILFSNESQAEPAVGLSRRFARYFPTGRREELWGGLAFVIVPVLLAAWVIRCRSEAIAERDPVTIEGKVLRQWFTKGKGGRVPHVAYEYPSPAGS
jgi:hypothetical protein